jgi:hypothetical protein
LGAGFIVFNLVLPDLDSNQDKQNQNLMCYRYTIGHLRCKFMKKSFSLPFVIREIVCLGGSCFPQDLAVAPCNISYFLSLVVAIYDGACVAVIGFVSSDKM